MKDKDLRTLRIEAFLKLAEGDKLGALSLLKSLVATDIEAEGAYIAVGTLLRDLGDAERAERVHRSMLENSALSPKTRELVIKQILLDLFEKGDYLSVILETEKQNTSLMPLRAKAYENLDFFIEAAETYKKCSKDNPLFLKRAARCYFAASKKEGETNSRVIRLLELAEKCDPLFFDAKAEKANLLFLDRRANKALAVLEEIVERNLPRCVEHMQMLENFYYSYAEVNKLFRAVMKKISQNSAGLPLYIFAIQNHIKRNEKEQAEALIESYKENNKFHVLLAQIIAQISKNEGLIEYFETCHKYMCENCSTKYTNYTDKCPHCKSVGTLTFL